MDVGRKLCQSVPGKGNNVNIPCSYSYLSMQQYLTIPYLKVSASQIFADGTQNSASYIPTIVPHIHIDHMHTGHAVYLKAYKVPSILLARHIQLSSCTIISQLCIWHYIPLYNYNSYNALSTLQTLSWSTHDLIGGNRHLMAAGGAKVSVVVAIHMLYRSCYTHAIHIILYTSCYTHHAIHMLYVSCYTNVGIVL